MDTVEVTLTLERPIAERLRDPGERARYEGRSSRWSREPRARRTSPRPSRCLPARRNCANARLKRAVEEMRKDAPVAGLTPEEVEQELAAWKQERSNRQ